MEPARAGSPFQKVLLVDDDPDIRRIAQLCLEVVGQRQVVLACDGEEALEVAGREQPDVILLDMMMPRLDGPDALARLKTTPATAQIPVILMTARVQMHEVDRHLANGAQGVIYKPFDPLTLPHEIDRIASRGGT